MTGFQLFVCEEHLELSCRCTSQLNRSCLVVQRWAVFISFAFFGSVHTKTLYHKYPSQESLVPCTFLVFAPDLCFLCTTPTWMCVHTIGPCVVLYCLFLASIIFFKNLTRYSLCEKTMQHYSRVWRDGQWLVQYFKNSGPVPPTVKRDKLSVLKILAISLYLTLSVTSTKNL